MSKSVSWFRTCLLHHWSHKYHVSTFFQIFCTQVWANDIWRGIGQRTHCFASCQLMPVVHWHDGLQPMLLNLNLANKKTLIAGPYYIRTATTFRPSTAVECLSPTNNFSLPHWIREIFSHFHYYDNLFFIPMRTTSHLASCLRRNFGTRSPSRENSEVAQYWDMRVLICRQAYRKLCFQGSNKLNYTETFCHLSCSIHASSNPSFVGRHLRQALLT